MPLTFGTDAIECCESRGRTELLRPHNPDSHQAKADRTPRRIKKNTKFASGTRHHERNAAPVQSNLEPAMSSITPSILALPDERMTSAQTAEMLKLSPRTLDQMRVDGSADVGRAAQCFHHARAGDQYCDREAYRLQATVGPRMRLSQSGLSARV